MDQKVKVIFRLERDDDGYPPEDFESLWGSRRTEGVEIDNGLLAVDVPPTVSLNSFRQHLLAGVRSGRWEAEEGHAADR